MYHHVLWYIIHLQYSPFTVFVRPSSLLMCVAYTEFDLAGYDCMVIYTLDSTVGALPRQVKFTLPGHLFTHLGFPKCSCCLERDIYPRFCYVYGLLNGFRFTDDERFFPSLYTYRLIIIYSNIWNHHVRYL